jgi:hypothetical protein
MIGRSQVYYFYSIGHSNVHKRKRIIAEMSMTFRSMGATRLTVPKLVLCYAVRSSSSHGILRCVLLGRAKYCGAAD